jgi:hypothetical protein
MTDLWLFIDADPSVGNMSPVNILKVVVFPAPFSPSNPKHYKNGEKIHDHHSYFLKSHPYS